MEISCDCKIRSKSVKEWIKKSLDYGIGIHLKNQNFFTNKKMFDFFKNKKIKILISDSSLSLGVNLPARTVILTGEMDSILYNQMGGRAGRRGIDNQGYILPIFSKY